MYRMFISTPALVTGTVDHGAPRMSISHSDTQLFSERQGQYLAFIYAYTKVNGRAPAQADIQKYFAVSPPSVHQMLLTLQRNGLLRRTPGKARSIEVLIPSDMLPVLR